MNQCTAIVTKKVNVDKKICMGNKDFFPGFPDANLCKNPFDFTKYMPAESCRCIPSADEECIINKASIPVNDRCCVVRTLDLLNGNAEACKTCLEDGCGDQFKTCFSSANTITDIEDCYLQNALDECREGCRESCSTCAGPSIADEDLPLPPDDIMTGDGGGGKYTEANFMFARIQSPRKHHLSL